MDDVQKLLIVMILSVLIGFAAFQIYIPIFFSILFLGFLKIVLYHPKYIKAKERFESLF